MNDPTYHDQSGRFRPGNPGGGRKPGSVSNPFKVALNELLDGERGAKDVEEFVARFRTMLLEGDGIAWRAALDRKWPVTQMLGMDPDAPFDLAKLVREAGSDDEAP